MPRNDLAPLHASINAALASIEQLKARVTDLEESDALQETTLQSLNTRLDSINQAIKLSRNIFSIIGGLVGPVVTALIILYFQHAMFH